MSSNPKPSRLVGSTIIAIVRSYAPENRFSRDEGFHSARSPGTVSRSLNILSLVWICRPHATALRRGGLGALHSQREGLRHVVRGWCRGRGRGRGGLVEGEAFYGRCCDYGRRETGSYYVEMK